MPKPQMSDLITRNYPAEFRADTEKNIITGIPIVFDTPTDIGGYFEETIDRGAIDEAILKDVAFYYNHDLNTKPLARTRTGKLQLKVTDKGVEMVAEVNRERTDVNDLYLAIQDGDIDGMSFMFRIEQEEWTDEDTAYPKRHIKKIGYVQEVSAVNYPAYPSTQIYARSDKSLDSDLKALDNARAAAVDTAEEKRLLDLEKAKVKYLTRR